MRVYWTVRKEDFDDFIYFIENKHKVFTNSTNLSHFKFYYNTNKRIEDVLYLCIDDDLVKGNYFLSYAYTDDANIIWFRNNSYIYKGEFNSRKKKLEKLNMISKS